MSAGYRLSKARTHKKTGHQCPAISTRHGKHRKVSFNTRTWARSHEAAATFSQMAQQPMFMLPKFDPFRKATLRPNKLRINK